MTKINIQKEIHIKVPVDTVWNISYNKFSEVDQWLTAVPKSTGTNPQNIEDTTCERQCTPNVKGFSKTLEVLEFVDADKKVLRYRLKKGLPGFVKTTTNEWSHIETEKGTTLHMNMKMELKGFLGFVMSVMMKGQLSSALVEALEDLKYYAEKGTPHPRKVKAAEKWARKNLKKAA